MGHILTDVDVVLLKQFGIETIATAVEERGDLDFKVALGVFAAKLTGDNVSYYVNDDGICKILSNAKGLFESSIDRVNKFNLLSKDLILNIVKPYTEVNKGEVIAELELTAPLFSSEKLDEILLKLSGNVDLISVALVPVKKVGIIYVNYYNDNIEIKYFTNVFKGLVTDLSGLGLKFSKEYNSDYDSDLVADRIEKSLKDDNDFIFILSSQKSSYENDVVVTAIKEITDDVVSLSIPQVGFSDFIVAKKRGKQIIKLPCNYATTDMTFVLELIKKVVFSDNITQHDFSRLQTPVINNLEKIGNLKKLNLISSQSSNEEGASKIGAVVLCAGAGKRSGKDKLLLDVDGEPLFMRAVTAALHSKLSPVFVITGHRGAEIEEYLKDVDVNIIYNSEYYGGVRTSINIGLKSMPNVCAGAMIIPADMPNLTREFLDEVVESFDVTQDKQVCMASCKGVKSNPIIWSKSLYNKADIVPENTHMRSVFMEHYDYTTVVDVLDENLLLDVNYSADFSKVLKK